MNTSYKFSALHVHFHHKNFRAFRQALEAARTAAANATNSNTHHAALSSSGSRSWQKSLGQSPINTHVGAASTEVANVRDPMGRTVLHLACSSVDPASMPFLQALLEHPLIDVNAQDMESGWTPLHRALWVGNLAAAVLLVARNDVNLELKDHEGYTAFDLYNSTVEGTVPPTGLYGDQKRDLFIWGTHRNNSAAKEDADKIYPSHIELERLDPEIASPHEHSLRFFPVKFRDIAMGRLHSVVVTDEKSGNLRASAQGNAGRLGSGASYHTQNTLVPLSHVAGLSIACVAVGQDHTLILTDSGEVYSWGFNRFSQLGYPVETAKNAAGQDDNVQMTAKKLTGSLNKERVKGIAASKIASTCWTENDVFTWGTNRGQLGYSKVAQPIQIQPRKVTPITAPVICAAMSDTALCILLATREVICFAHDTHFKVNLPMQPFPPEIKPSYSPSVVAKSRYRRVEKIVCCEETFAIISESGDVLSWSIGGPDVAPAGGSITVKPQRVWTSSRQLNSAKDVALGSEGTVIICTESGHAWVRSKNSKPALAHSASNASNPSGNRFTFQRVPFINRVVKVTASPIGTFSAMTLDAVPQEIVPKGQTLNEDLAELLPFTRRAAVSGRRGQTVDDPVAGEDTRSEGDDYGEGAAVVRDVATVKRMCETLSASSQSGPLPYARAALEASALRSARTTRGGDVLVCVAAFEIPAHSAILAARSRIVRQQVFAGVQIGGPILSISLVPAARPQLPRLDFMGCHPLAVLLLLQYLYTDDIAAIWDRRVGLSTEAAWHPLNATPSDVKAQVLRLARLLELPRLAKALEGIVKMVVIPTLKSDITQYFFSTQKAPSHPVGVGSHDVIVQLSDRAIPCHSAILRVRSAFFAAMFNDPEWTSERRDGDNVVTVDLRHLGWTAVQYVFRYMYCAEEREMFEDVDLLQTTSELVDHIFLVMAAATELLVEKLILVCARIIADHVSIQTVASLLRDASDLHVVPLVQSLQQYICINLEALLQNGLLEDLPPEILNPLSCFVRGEQSKKQPVSRSNQLPIAVMKKWGDWLALQDVPPPFYTRSSKAVGRTSPKLKALETEPSPSAQRTIGIPDAVLDTNLGPSIGLNGQVGLSVDDAPSADQRKTPPSTSSSLVWKAKGLPRSEDKHDLRTIMESQKDIVVPSTPKRQVVGFNVDAQSSPSESQKWTPKSALRERRKSHQNLELTPTTVTPPCASPWRAVPATKASLAEIDSQARLPTKISPPNSPATLPAASAPSNLTRAMSANQNPSVKVRSSPSKEKPSRPGMGPVINPTRMSSFGNIAVTTKKGGDAWNPTPTPPSKRSQSGRSHKSEPSPSEIPQASKKSLKEIQEEEQERQVQADFERWWAEEEARVKAEEDALLAAVKAASMVEAGRGGKSSRGRGKRKPPSPLRKPSNGPDASGPPHQGSSTAIPISDAGGTRGNGRSRRS